MAVWDVGPPRAVASATMRAVSSPAVSEGVRSSATRITGPSGRSAAALAVASSGARRASTRRPTSRRSAARAASSGLPMAAMRSAVRLTASCQAHAGPCPSTISWQARTTRSVSDRNSACALKMPASAAPRRRPVSSARAASCCFVATMASFSRSPPSIRGSGISGTTISAGRTTWRRPTARPGRRRCREWRAAAPAGSSRAPRPWLWRRLWRRPPSPAA